MTLTYDIRVLVELNPSSNFDIVDYNSFKWPLQMVVRFRAKLPIRNKSTETSLIFFIL